MPSKQARLQTFQRQIKRLQTRSAALHTISNRYSWLRLLIFLIGVGISVVLLYTIGSWAFAVSLIITIIVFSIAATLHGRVKNSIRRLDGWSRLKAQHVARMTLDWKGIPAVRGIQPTAGHPFETDLDLIGDRSLHQLLNTAVTREGTERLREWLTATPDLAAAQRRQAIVTELTPLSLFRDKLILTANIDAKQCTSVQWQGKSLIDWLNATLPTRSLRPVVIVLIGLAIIDFLLATNIVRLPVQVLGVSFLTYALISIFALRQIGDLFGQAADLQDSLRSLQAVLLFLETYRYTDRPHLKKLCEPLLKPGHRPSDKLRGLGLIVSVWSLERNEILWLLLNAVVPWGIFFADLFNHYKVNLVEVLPGWLDVWFELEALSSLATFAYLNPDYTMPVLVADSADQQLAKRPAPITFCMEAIGHPMIPDDQRVCNDFSIETLGKVALITGSNMAGKSSFLRTLGVNLCLAYAGGPVTARRMETSAFRVFTCLKVSDSVTDGVSYFYAEVKRLKALLTALEQRDTLPLFFLIDEIFRGTNNRERLIGSRSYIRALVGQHGLGAISTHDLELIRLADELPQITNYHFAETVIEAQMIFDYKLRPGPSPTTNALKIMQMEGLPVDAG